MSTNNGFSFEDDEPEVIPEYKPDWLVPTFTENFQVRKMFQMGCVFLHALLMHTMRTPKENCNHQ